jgi:cytochrome c553
MKRLLIVIVVLVILAAGALALLSRTDASAGRAPELAGALPNAASVARGEYLTKAADCIACHTAG